MLKAEALSTKEAKEGKILSYIHAERIGVLLEISSQTDFVARSPEFLKFCEEVAMQIAASSPLYVSPSDVNSRVQEQHRAIFRAQLKEQGKPEKSWNKIVEGKLGAWLTEVCLTEQESVIHPKKTIEDLQNELIAKCGENIRIRRFVRWELGESTESNSQVALA
jgi:elongation factor Ts